MNVLFRKRLVRSVLSTIDDGETVSAESVSKSVTVLNAINFVNLAAKDITPNSVEKCFVKAGIPLTGQHEEYENDDVPLAELVEIMRAAQGMIHTEEPLTAEYYDVIDQDAPIHEELDSEWESELVNAVIAKNLDESEILEVEDEDDTEHNPEQPTLSHKEALQMVEQLKTFSLRNDIHEAFAMFQDAQEVIEKEAIQLMSKAKQTSIDQYFTPTK